ncbi:hypothetical protein BDAP_001339 [Binucleata daphniae]
MSSSTDYSSDTIEYEIKKIDENDEIQVINLIANTKIYDDTNEVWKLVQNDAYKACSDDFIFAILSIVRYKDIEPHLNKKINENIKKMLNKYRSDNKTLEELQFMVHKKICNSPYTSIIDLHKKMKNKVDTAIVISQCDILRKEEHEIICKSFCEYKKEDLKCYPKNEEEIYYLQNNIIEQTFESNSQHYKIFLINNKNYKKFINLLKKELEIK